MSRDHSDQHLICSAAEYISVNKPSQLLITRKSFQMSASLRILIPVKRVIDYAVSTILYSLPYPPVPSSSIKSSSLQSIKFARLQSSLLHYLTPVASILLLFPQFSCPSLPTNRILQFLRSNLVSTLPGLESSLPPSSTASTPSTSCLSKQQSACAKPNPHPP